VFVCLHNAKYGRISKRKVYRVYKEAVAIVLHLRNSFGNASQATLKKFPVLCYVSFGCVDAKI